MSTYKSNIQKLDSPWRRTALPPEETLRSLGLTENGNLADIGCGIGYFSIPAAAIIGYGHLVYAIDPSEEMIEEATKRANAAGLDNIRFIQSDPLDFKLPESSVEFALLANVFHEIPEKDLFLAQVWNLLKPDGKLILIEWNPEVKEYGPPLAHRITEKETDRLMEVAGFHVLMKKPISGLFFGRLYQK
jgi:ubiquinone/menaquinone biosynthesis C-methylase UbiE